MHVGDLGIDCVTCHHETAAEKLAAPHPDYFAGFWVNCATCHTGKPASATSRNCSSCHPAKPARGTDEMPSVKVAIHRSCWTCHEEKTGAEASTQCATCHQKGSRARPRLPGRAAPSEVSMDRRDFFKFAGTAGAALSPAG